MGRARGVGVVVAVLVAMLAGCAEREIAASASVPPIEHARDARTADPCALPTGAQLASLGITGPGTAGTVAEGRTCTWRTISGTGPELGITLFVDGGGLATLAANSEPTTSRVRLAGYPALETFTGAGEFCQYDVGVAADQVLMASLEGGEPDSCTALQAVLPGLMANLPALP